MPEHWASSSRSVEGNIAELGSSFTVLEAISNNPQGEGLYLGLCLDLGSPIREHTWKFWNLGDPATILFVLELDLESHDVCFQPPSVLRRPVRPALPVEHPGSAAKAALNDCPHKRKGKGAHLAAFVSCIPLFGSPALILGRLPRDDLVHRVPVSHTARVLIMQNV